MAATKDLHRIATHAAEVGARCTTRAAQPSGFSTATCELWLPIEPG